MKLRPMTCEHCGAERVANEGARFCSKECHWETKRKNCPTCGKRIKASHGGHCSRRCQIEADDRRAIAEAERHIGEPLGQFLRRRYVKEQATYREVMVELGLADNARRLKRWFALHGIRPRSKSEAVRLQHQRDPARGKQFALWLASDEARCKMARSRQANVNLSTLQAAALALARELGLSPVPEYAVEFYNIDLALPDQMVAVELNGGNWHIESKDRERDEALEAAGWKVYRFRDVDFGRLLRLLESLV